MLEGWGEREERIDRESGREEREEGGLNYYFRVWHGDEAKRGGFPMVGTSD